MSRPHRGQRAAYQSGQLLTDDVFSTRHLVAVASRGRAHHHRRAVWPGFVEHAAGRGDVLVAQTFLVIYLLMYVSVVRLRITQPYAPRPFKIPGGKIGFALEPTPRSTRT